MEAEETHQGNPYGPNGGSHFKRIAEQSQRARDEAQAFAGALEGVVDEVRELLVEQLEQRPYVTLGAMAGLGYVLGGGVPRRASGIALAIGGRIAVNMALREILGGQADAPDPTPADPARAAGHGARTERTPTARKETTSKVTPPVPPTTRKDE